MLTNDLTVLFGVWLKQLKHMDISPLSAGHHEQAIMSRPWRLCLCPCSPHQQRFVRRSHVTIDKASKKDENPFQTSYVSTAYTQKTQTSKIKKKKKSSYHPKLQQQQRMLQLYFNNNSNNNIIIINNNNNNKNSNRSSSSSSNNNNNNNRKAHRWEALINPDLTLWLSAVGQRGTHTQRLPKPVV